MSLVETYHRQYGSSWKAYEVYSVHGIGMLGGVLLMLHWYGKHVFSFVQLATILWVFYDLCGGFLTYNSKHFARKKAEVSSSRNPTHIFFHNFVHIHPLIVGLFDTEWLMYILIFDVIVFAVDLLRFEDSSEWMAIDWLLVLVLAAVIVFFCILVAVSEADERFWLGVYLCMVFVSWLCTSVFQDRSGVFVLSVAVLSFLVGNLAVARRKVAFRGWFFPVYFLKVVVGYL